MDRAVLSKVDAQMFFFNPQIANPQILGLNPAIANTQIF
jgi:hypothetical protein